CLDLPDMGEAVTKVENVAGYSVISYTRFRSSYKRLWIKRGIDIVGGLVGLLLTAVLTLFIAPAIKLDSPGPVFFSQIRVGKNGRRFRIYKFRSMYQDAEERLAELMKDNEMNGLMFKMENDPRITPVGNFLRKTSLDEFPQFWNVLKGDMSLVGTRPPTEQEFEQYNEHYRRRISMTPGLTGMWQVSGRSDITDFDEVVRLDLEYIDNWSLTLDIKILLQTVGVLFNRKGAK
ncbi:MAG: sugar transferase, partial [Lachnospiraceae bacterium]|nr:sugar transferase [Lachnospiraceae bacterium]